ncbi:MAG TPA: SDR family NAD(P)-dependent oxidoreductase [Hyphomicrobiales bacterium]|nr:SDR family NAD(P)-dependent oxidoreductase [Hyphomicrobiales bacterium]
MPLSIASAAGKVILLTGANRGIGLATARELQKRGAKVIAGVRNPDKMPSIPDIRVMRLDTADAASCEAFAASAEKEEGRIDGLINNAAILIDQGKAALALSDRELREVMEVNLIGPIRLCRLVVPGMLKRGYGRIVNITSGLASIGDMGGGYLSYRMSKLALNGFTRVLAAELGLGSNVKVNSISPGWTRTDMGGPGATRDPADPAREIADLISIADNGPTGGFFYKGEPAVW